MPNSFSSVHCGENGVSFIPPGAITWAQRKAPANADRNLEGNLMRHSGIRFGAGVVFIAALVFLCAALPAQDLRARLQGVVSDASQAVVVGAKVTLLNVNTGESA